MYITFLIYVLTITFLLAHSRAPHVRYGKASLTWGPYFMPAPLTTTVDSASKRPGTATNLSIVQNSLQQAFTALHSTPDSPSACLGWFGDSDEWQISGRPSLCSEPCTVPCNPHTPRTCTAMMQMEQSQNVILFGHSSFRHAAWISTRRKSSKDRSFLETNQLHLLPHHVDSICVFLHWQIVNPDLISVRPP